MSDELISQVTASGIVVWLLQHLKQSGWAPWITQSTDNLNRIVAVVLATATTAGIAIASAWDGGTLTLTISGLTVSNILTFVWKIANGVVMQEIIYRGAVKEAKPIVIPRTVTPAVTESKVAAGAGN